MKATLYAALLLAGLIGCSDSGGGSTPTEAEAGAAEAGRDADSPSDASDEDADADARTSTEGDAQTADADADVPARRVFVTSSRHAGDLGGPEGADAICMARATEAGLVGEFVAWLSTPDENAEARLDTGNAGAFVRLDGEIVARNLADLTDGELSVPIEIDENGARVNDDVWTGTLASGVLEPDRHCEGFTTASTGAAGVCGRASATNENWSAILAPNCSARLRVYCFER